MSTGIVINVSRNISYRNFGFIPKGKLLADFYGKLFGYQNLMKRLQAKEIMQALDLKPSDIVLDFGCGVGYFTVEMAKLARKACGIDINPILDEIQVPPSLAGRLVFIRTHGEALPFKDHTFDRVLASEILPMIPDPNIFFREIKRVIKPGGYLVIVNGMGHPAIQEAFENRAWFLRLLQQFYPKRMPKSYEEYCEILQRSFGTAQKRFLQHAELEEWCKSHAFIPLNHSFSPSYWAGAYISWRQFLAYLRTGRTLSQHNFVLNYFFWQFVGYFQRRRYGGGLIYVAQSQ